MYIWIEDNVAVAALLSKVVERMVTRRKESCYYVYPDVLECM